MGCGKGGGVTGSKGSAPGGNGVSCSWGRKLCHSHEMSSARPSRRPVNDITSQIQQWILLQASKQADNKSSCLSAIVSNNTVHTRPCFKEAHHLWQHPFGPQKPEDLEHVPLLLSTIR